MFSSIRYYAFLANKTVHRGSAPVYRVQNLIELPLDYLNRRNRAGDDALPAALLQQTENFAVVAASQIIREGFRIDFQ
jgi:hypothetical protein